MKFKGISTTQGGLKQYTFRINEKEIDSLFTALELVHNLVPKQSDSILMTNLRTQINNARREIKKAKKDIQNDTN